MKNFLIAALFVLPVSVFAQNSAKAAKPYGHKTAEPVYYIDGKKTSTENLKEVSPESIKSVEIKKDLNPPEIYITTKPGKYTMYTFSDVVKKYKIPTAEAETALITLDGKIVSNRENIRIDSTTVIDAKLTSFEKFDYLPQEFRKMKVLEIMTKASIRIRGGLASTGE
ncbi:MAG: hypothetical protein INR69_07900 [Mucilaginibacter polytrichastri]|nr:hypothetical protein [Mucilaginibacter polytrichastri]